MTLLVGIMDASNGPLSSHAIAAKLLRFEGRFAVLSSDSMGEFRWPRQNLPENSKIGEILNIQIITEKGEQDEKYERMRRLLEELIN